MNCPRGCGREARRHPLYGILPCLKCIAEDKTKRTVNKAPEFYTLSQQTRIQEQRDRHEADMMSPYDHNGKPSEEFRRAFPNKAQDLFTEYERVTQPKSE